MTEAANSRQENEQNQRVGAACAAWQVSEFALNCRIQDNEGRCSTDRHN
jgi:hypothetical protein